MTKFFTIISTIVILFFTNCARDLSDNMYVSDSTTNFTLQGTIINVRAVKVKEGDRLLDNSAGVATGALAGGGLASTTGSGSGKSAAIVGGAIIGGIIGGAVQDKLGTKDGFEYTVKVDLSKVKDTYYEGSVSIRNIISLARINGLLTVVQSGKESLKKGQNVFIVFSDNRTRVIPA